MAASMHTGIIGYRTVNINIKVRNLSSTISAEPTAGDADSNRQTRESVECLMNSMSGVIFEEVGEHSSSIFENIWKKNKVAFFFFFLPCCSD